jgi:hypothetical protein
LYPTRLGRHGDEPGGVVPQGHTEFVVELGLVRRFRFGEHLDDVLQYLHERLDLFGRELATGDVLAELALEGLPLSLRQAGHDARRLSAALIGIAGSIGAFGGVLVNLALRQSFLNSKTGNSAYVAFIIYYVVCLAVTWFVYIRKSKSHLEGV